MDNSPPAPVVVPSVEPAETAPAPNGASGPPVPADQTTLENSLLEPARSALARDPQEALARLAVYDSTVRNPRLTEERDDIAFEALRRQGRHGEARARGEAFLARYPRSIYADSVRRALAAMP